MCQCPVFSGRTPMPASASGRALWLTTNGLGKQERHSRRATISDAGIVISSSGKRKKPWPTPKQLRKRVCRSTQLLMLRGQSLVRLGKYQEAIGFLAEAIRLYPRTGEEKSLTTCLGFYGEALRTQAIQGINRDPERSHCTRAEVCGQLLLAQLQSQAVGDPAGHGTERLQRSNRSGSSLCRVLCGARPLLSLTEKTRGGSSRIVIKPWSLIATCPGLMNTAPWLSCA